jgi:hypothetical protein
VTTFDHIVREHLPDDRVLFRWTDVERAEVCEVTFELDELAAMERREVISDPSPVRRWPLGDAIAATESRLEGLRHRRDQLRRNFPELEEG